MSVQTYQAAFFIVPSRILELEGLTMAYLRLYEIIFQFWHHKKPCFLGNDSFKERAKIKSSATIQAAFEFFEKHNEIKRIQKGTKRYIIQPEMKIEQEKKPVDNSQNNSTKNSQGLGLPRAGSRSTEREGLGLPRHNMNNINMNKLNRAIEDNENIDRDANSSVNLYKYPDDFFPDPEKRDLLSIHAKRTNNSEKELLDRFETVHKKYKTKSNDWQFKFEQFLISEMPKKIYENEKGQIKRQSDQSRCY